MIEREKWTSLNCLRNDNDDGYTLKEFKNYCLQHGIKLEKIIPSIPKHNGVVEDINRTIL